MELEDFKKQFKKIVHKKGLLTTQNLYISKLSRFDKNSSHTNAILKALDKKDIIKKELDEMLSGKTYDEWKNISKKLSSLTSRLKGINVTKIIIENNINDLIDF